MANYRPGELDQRITIQRETLADDGYGGQTVTLSTVATVWAHVRPMNGREAEHAQQLEATAMYLFVIRHLAGILPNDRIAWGGETYNIRFPRYRSGRQLYLEIEAEHGVAP